MSEQTPVLVALKFLGANGLVRVAEFRLNQDGQATLTILDPKKARLAQEYYDHGVELIAAGGRVRPEDGPAFMRALMQPFRMSYYHFFDESDGAETP